MNPGVDLDWHEVTANAFRQECVPVLATDPLYILYTSGTTGDPKVRFINNFVLIAASSMQEGDIVYS